jgi:hypothetical protein
MKATIRFFTEDGRKVMRLVDPRERLELLASEQAEKVLRADGTTDGSIKLRVYQPEAAALALPIGITSSCGLTSRDSFANAAGSIDTPKRQQVYKMRKRAQDVADETGEECKSVPASIRCFGHNAMKKPDAQLIGNATDRAMSRVERWPSASETNRSVTCTPSGVVGVTEIPREDLAQMRSLAL